MDMLELERENKDLSISELDFMYKSGIEKMVKT